MDKKHGHGIFSWESGNVYKGNYKEDERDGYGEMYWTDGSQYKGDWKKGVQHGYGSLVAADGTHLEGYYDNNMYVGKSPTRQGPIMEDYDGELTATL